MSAVASLSVVILAAGQGKRMKSAMPKVLHPIAGRPMLSHVIDTVNRLKPKQIVVVYGHGGEQVKSALQDSDVLWKKQGKQLGTGHAVEQAMPAIADEDTVLILYGDVPLVRTDTLAGLVCQGEAGFGLLSVHLDVPHGYGRIVRNPQGKVEKIVEEKDADGETLAITEINTGILCTGARKLRQWLRKLENNNVQDEYYLTDIIEMAVQDGIVVNTSHPVSEQEVAGVNSRAQLAELERHYQQQQAEWLMTQGVSLIDPQRLDIRGTVTTGQDVIIDINVILEGEVRLGNNVRIGAGCVISDSQIGDGTVLYPYSVVEQAQIGAQVQIGPFARIRPGTRLADESKIGNFVEIKNSDIGHSSKVNHLSYVGDTLLGNGVNIGAGMITANYDGANKHRTEIGDKVSIGANSVLVAPVKVGEGATLGAATVLRKDAPEGELTLITTKQKTITGWKRPTKSGK